MKTTAGRIHNEHKVCIVLRVPQDMRDSLISAVDSYNEAYTRSGGEPITYEVGEPITYGSGQPLAGRSYYRMRIECNAIDLLWLGRRWERRCGDPMVGEKHPARTPS